jgi:hypothetical protein
MLFSDKWSLRTVLNFIYLSFERSCFLRASELIKLKNLWVMKREGFSLFANLYGAKGSTEKTETSTSSEVITTSSAQPHVLREKMREKKLTHGETVTASISPVRLESASGKMALYFCPMQTLEVLETITPGDGGDIPSNVVVEGLTVPAGHKPGLYTLKNVKLSSNGAMQVIADAKTTWEIA